MAAAKDNKNNIEDFQKKNKRVKKKKIYQKYLVIKSSCQKANDKNSAFFATFSNFFAFDIFALGLPTPLATSPSLSASRLSTPSFLTPTLSTFGIVTPSHTAATSTSIFVCLGAFASVYCVFVCFGAFGPICSVLVCLSASTSDFFSLFFSFLAHYIIPISFSLMPVFRTPLLLLENNYAI